MWGWLWWPLAVLPVFPVVGGVSMVITRRVPRYPTYTWEWNFRTYTRATDIRALGWYYVTLGGALGAFYGYGVLWPTHASRYRWWIPLGALWLTAMLLFVVARRWRRRAFTAPTSRDGDTNGPIVDPSRDDAGR